MITGTSPVSVTSNPPVLRVKGVSKAFPGVQALRDVHLEVVRGEIHALVGENGAGKSTLMRILFGVHRPDEGEIELNGHPAMIGSPHEAQRLGIAMVHQELNLVPSLDIGRNILLGREPALAPGIIDWRRLYQQATAVLAQLHVRLNVRTPVRLLSVAQKQLVEIARALSWQPSLLILDEPTSSLSSHEIADLFTVLRSLRDRGVAILYISHRLEELAHIADRVTVLRDGQYVGTVEGKTPVPAIIRMMVGRSLDRQFPQAHATPGDEVLRVEGLTRRGVFSDVSFSVHRGEIVGFAGLVGAGRTEVMRALFGADPIDAGSVWIAGQPVVIRSPQDAVAAGLGLLPEDRKSQGLVLLQPVKTNISLAVLHRFSRLGLVRQRPRAKLARRFVGDLRIRTPTIDFPARNLSGGNQQKVVLAKWLAANPRVLIFDEPTRGIDVGAKVEVYHLMQQLAASGVGIVLVSSELPEILGMSDRILVMREGRLVANLSRDEATQERIIAYASGQTDDE